VVLHRAVARDVATALVAISAPTLSAEEKIELLVKLADTLGLQVPRPAAVNVSVPLPSQAFSLVSPEKPPPV
jgi:hypothetical protein